MRPDIGVALVILLSFFARVLPVFQGVARPWPNATRPFVWPATAKASVECWSGSVYTYDYCCACGNEFDNNMSGRDKCWLDGFDLEACCTFYGSTPADPPHLPCWRDASGPKRVLELQLAGRPWSIAQKPVPPFGKEHVMAYVLWPSAYALASWMLHDLPHLSLTGRRVLELGAGVGLPSMAAALLGAEALATDVDREAVAISRQVARRNLQPAERNRFRASILDFTDAEAVAAEEPVDVVLISGQLYSKALSGPLLSALRVLCPRGCSVLLAYWIAAEFVELPLKFYEAAEAHFQVREAFQCSDRGYLNPGALYTCIRMVRTTSG